MLLRRLVHRSILASVHVLMGCASRCAEVRKICKNLFEQKRLTLRDVLDECAVSVPIFA